MSVGCVRNETLKCDFFFLSVDVEFGTWHLKLCDKTGKVNYLYCSRSSYLLPSVMSASFLLIN
jgi:hypothetical protein